MIESRKTSRDYASTENGSSHKLVHRLVETYPEMTWLTGSVEASPESHGGGRAREGLGHEFFPHLSKKDVVEFERTAVGILAMQWVLQGDYDQFTACQTGKNKLSRESFEELRAYTKTVLKNSEDVRAMETFMVINDLGKINSVVKIIEDKTGVHDVDHDRMLLLGLSQHPEISPSFQNLSPHHQKMIIEGLRTEFNIGQFIQAESVPKNLSKLAQVDGETLKFYLVHALYDIAGAAGQNVQNGSVILNEPTYDNFRLALRALEPLSQGALPEDVYDSYLSARAEKFGITTSDPSERAVARIACMLRLSERVAAQEVLRVFKELPKNTRAILERALNVRSDEEGLSTLVYYAPAFLTNLQKKFAAQGLPQATHQALSLGLSTLARVFQEALIAHAGKPIPEVYTIMASGFAKIAADDPEKLTTHALRLKQVGNDAEIELAPISAVDEERFVRMESLQQIPGKRIAVVGIGGGSDCIQAALLGKLLRGIGKECPAVISIRSEKTTSQGPKGHIGEQRTVENYGEELAPGVYTVTSETRGSGRFLEHIPANELPVYLVVERADMSLEEQIQEALNHAGAVDCVVAVDTGGDALYGPGNREDTQATPDQDLRSLRAINKLANVRKVSCEIAVGIDTPPDGEKTLHAAEATYFEPSPRETSLLLSTYAAWHMDGSDETRFGKTPLSWQLALADKIGFQEINLPTRVVLDAKNPWRPFVHIQPSTKGMFFMDIEKHLRAIGSS